MKLIDVFLWPILALCTWLDRLDPAIQGSFERWEARQKRKTSRRGSELP